ncbi:hypothetical protein BD560DRAFT_450161 [Blakeslea trispora]|nr:hypothetical protein BD560DRAFT_450161 [Blakeslea trispora]
MYIAHSIVFVAIASQAYAASIQKRTHAPQFQPYFPNIEKPTDVVTSYNPGPYDTSASLSTAQLAGFPTPWTSPPTDSAEVLAVYNKIDWSLVPKAPVRKQDANGAWLSTSDGESDPYCWWSSTNCVKPKASYLPPDIYTCPNAGDWGLNYDDGPFNRYTDSNAKVENEYAEPALYNFLARNNLHSTLFYIGSNVATYPAAAKRGLNNGNQLCVHTWSHPPMTTQTDKQVVAELYWTLKAIKAATGVTSKCWRPPQGDVDDRVRAIAWQMGLRTILWDADTEDWNISGGPNYGTLSPKKVDSMFSTWISNYKTGKDKSGHIVLEHELNHVTVNMSMFWLPKLKETFNVIPALSCNGITQPYWEENFVYPISDSSSPSTKTFTTTKTISTTKGPTSTTFTQTTTKSISTTTATTKSTSPTSTSCIAGVAGKKKGNGKTGYCCTTSDDCLETCRSGKCGL